ncbi:hypothetical protein [Ilyobacter polytropus]|uniref:Uncharacterized protein n=1 Tax=Ilyobacter polytropus (strain ATCC 51220 / DSM 2926 / LMG 16218 / CuHBu1) TaxID=572544 RepID=E3HBS4_ILYPC|nr:hypothetical protein [Ilyobacter polytropus]ADO83836.1 hypothetical protein Ilyop_2066 [Ilyobacter polytropus DSM 2926]
MHKQKFNTILAMKSFQSVPGMETNYLIFTTPLGFVSGNLISENEHDKVSFDAEDISKLNLSFGLKSFNQAADNQEKDIEKIDFTKVIPLKDVTISLANGKIINTPSYLLFIDSVLGITIGNLNLG